MLSKLHNKKTFVLLILILLSQVALACGEQSPEAKIPPTVLTKATISIPSVPSQVTGSQPINLANSYNGNATYAFWSQDGKRIINLGTDNAVRAFDLNGTLLGVMQHPSSTDFMSLALSNNGKMIASASIDRTFMLWDAETFQPIKKLEFKADYETAKIIFTPDDKYLITANFWGYNGSLMIDLDSGAVQTLFTSPVWITAFGGGGKSGKYVFGFYDGNIKIWDYASRKFTDLNPEKSGYTAGQITTLVIPDDGTELIGIIQHHPNFSILRWNFQSQSAKMLQYQGKEELNQNRHANVVDTYQNLIAIGTRESQVVILDRETGTLLTTLKNRRASNVIVKFNSLNGLLLGAGRESPLKVWDSNNWAVIMDTANKK
jgi:WD40 repeat protein